MSNSVCVCGMLCMVILMGAWIAFIIWGAILLDGSDEYVGDQCFIFDRVKTDCSGNKNQYTYYATSNYCGPNVTLEIDGWEEIAQCRRGSPMDIDKTYDCYFNDDSCDQQIFSLTSPSGHENEAIGMIITGCCGIICVFAICYKIWYEFS